VKVLRLFAEEQLVNKTRMCRVAEIADNEVSMRLAHITREVGAITNKDDHWFHWLPDALQWSIGYTLRNALRRHSGMRIT